MKKRIIIVSIFVFLSLNINYITTIAQPVEYSQGIYTLRDLKLMENITYNVENVSQYGTSSILIVDTNQRILQLIRLEPKSLKYTLIPIKYEYTIIIYGNGKVVFS